MKQNNLLSYYCLLLLMVVVFRSTTIDSIVVNSTIDVTNSDIIGFSTSDKNNDSINDKQQTHHDLIERDVQQQQQQQNYDDDLSSLSSSLSSSCSSFCHNLTLLGDKEVPTVDPYDDQNTTISCSEIDLYYQYNFTATPTATALQRTSCIPNPEYNYYFDLCCMASIPKCMFSNTDASIYHLFLPLILQCMQFLTDEKVIEYLYLNSYFFSSLFPLFVCLFLSFLFPLYTTDECEENIHQQVIQNNPKYNTAVPPFVGPNEKLTVSVFLQFEALEHIEIEEGTATIFVSIVLKWIDPRLAWDITKNDTCSNYINVFTGYDIETTQIWVPDFDVINKIEGVKSMPSFKATVFRYVRIIYIYIIYISYIYHILCSYKV